MSTLISLVEMKLTLYLSTFEYNLSIYLFQINIYILKIIIMY